MMWSKTWTFGFLCSAAHFTPALTCSFKKAEVAVVVVAVIVLLSMTVIIVAAVEEATTKTVAVVASVSYCLN